LSADLSFQAMAKRSAETSVALAKMEASEKVTAQPKGRGSAQTDLPTKRHERISAATFSAGRREEQFVLRSLGEGGSDVAISNL
jgi:hypothetical protein